MPVTAAKPDARSRLLDAGPSLIRTKGYSANTIDDLCAAAEHWSETTGALFSDDLLPLVFPVLLEESERFFSDSSGPRELALVSATTAPSGRLMNPCRPAGSLRTGSYDEPA